MRLFTEKQEQGQGKQAAEMNALGHRIMEMKDLLIQRKLRMEPLMQEVGSQIQTMGAMLKDIQPQIEDIVPMGSAQDTKDLPPKPTSYKKRNCQV